eukprot:TRINITY_DN1411_c0_g1_i1.p1 TRINITY_DN1411_c0_g1~~TRINITY_DN1411_c0_g1_i1.p1  ORF type:complete len:528 (+),score=177.82 TRINITY_DN1411_c0_g1_i1:352-1935(+)
MSFFGLNFGQSAEVDIILDDQDRIKTGELKDENGRKERYFLFYDGESVSGKVNVTLHRKTAKLEHQGIKIEFIGQIELYYDRGNNHEFLSLCKGLAQPGELTQSTSFDFEFNKVEKPYECYTGGNVRLRYFLRVSIVRRLTDITKEMNILVHTLAHFPEANNPIKMEVGIEDCLHIEFEYNKSKYHLKDVIVGKIYFLLVRIKIKYMEIAIIKKESTGSGPSTFNESETIAKYEIMDGAPVKGESIPIRVFLAGYDLTPTMREVNKKFSVKYFLNLVLVDEEERRYFKQQEITLWRKSDKARKILMSSSGHPQGLPLGNNTSAASLPPHLSPLMPHAMARHYPTAGKDVRTAPTPTSPLEPPGNPTATVIPNTHLLLRGDPQDPQWGGNVPDEVEVEEESKSSVANPSATAAANGHEPTADKDEETISAAATYESNPSSSSNNTNNDSKPEEHPHEGHEETEVAEKEEAPAKEGPCGEDVKEDDISSSVSSSKASNNNNNKSEDQSTGDAKKEDKIDDGPSPVALEW